MKSRTILKYQYDEIGGFLCDQYLKKHDLFKKKKEYEKKVKDILMASAPDLIVEAYKKYPEYFITSSVCISRDRFSSLFEQYTIDRKQVDIDYFRYKKCYYGKEKNEYNSQKREEISNYIYTKLKDLKILDTIKYMYKAYSSKEYHDGELMEFNISGFGLGNIIEDGNYRYMSYKNILPVCEWLCDHKDVTDIIIEYLVELSKYLKFVQGLSCAFATITTTNMLKNEIPEAYKFFYDKYGKEYEEQDLAAENKKKEKKSQCDQIEALRASIS